MKKVHVSVGTIGHIDHGKTTLTTAILAVQARRGLASAKSYRDIARGGLERDPTKTVTIATSHVRYETAEASTPASTTGACSGPRGSRAA